MTEAFKKWLCELADIKKKCDIYYGHSTILDKCECLPKNITLEILIKAKWALNREAEKYFITQTSISYCLIPQEKEKEPIPADIHFSYEDHNNSEQEALTAALKYIFDNRNKE
jgi:hypothetical protein